MAISMEGFQDIQAVPLGMDLILLSSTKHEGVKKAAELNEAWWEKRFLDIKGWDPSQQPRGRRVWVRIFGTPIHAWGWDCFEKIVCTWGRLIRLDEQTKNQDRLDVARAQVFVHSWDFVDRNIEIKVKEKLFTIRVVEERFGDIDLGISRQAGSQICEEEGSVGESETRRVVDRASDIGWQEGWSDEDRDDSEQCEPADIDQQQVSINGQCGTDEREQTHLVKAIKSTDKVPEVRVEGGKGNQDGDVLVELVKEILTQQESREDVGEKLLLVGEDVLALQRSRAEVSDKRREVGLVGSQSVEVIEVDSPQTVSGPVVISPFNPLLFKMDKKQKQVVVCEREVDFKYRDLMRGSCSHWAEASNGLGQRNCSEENNLTKLLKDKEVAKLAFEELQEHISQPESVAKKALQRSIFPAGLTKCERFAQAIQKGGRGKKGKRKTKKNRGNNEGAGESSDSISNGSTGAACDDGHRNHLQISAIQVAPVGGESNEVYALESRAYRIEAERLFNIGANLGATSNEERITMIERLMDMESNDMVREDDLGDDEVDQ
jgi:hypothetical protein